MHFNLFKICAVALFSWSQGTIASDCSLRYVKEIEGKPDLVVATSRPPGLCRIHNDEVSDQNYHPQKPTDVANSTPEIEIDRADPNESVKYLNYDASDNVMFYLSKSSYDSDVLRLNRLRANVRENDFALESFGIDKTNEIGPFFRREINNVAYDWVTKNAYLDLSKTSEESSIWAVSLDANKIRLQRAREILPNRTRITSLLVHPNEGYVFFIETSNYYVAEEPSIPSKIYRANQDGADLMEIGDSEVDQEYHNLAIDFHNDRLYWSVDNTELVQHSRLDGSDPREIAGHPIRVSRSRSIAFDENHLYYLHARKNLIRRFRKTDGVLDSNFTVLNEIAKTKIAEIMIYDGDSQKTREDHPCKINNGDCEGFCFAVPRGGMLERACACSYTEKLAEDGVSCVKL